MPPWKYAPSRGTLCASGTKLHKIDVQSPRNFPWASRSSARNGSGRERKFRRRRSARPDRREAAMRRALRRVLVPALATLLYFASSAAAESAWVLWSGHVDVVCSKQVKVIRDDRVSELGKNESVEKVWPSEGGFRGVDETQGE